MFGKKKKAPEPIVVREYDSAKKYEKDAREMAKLGYVVHNVAAVAPPKASLPSIWPGASGIIAGTKIIVTYTLAAPAHVGDG